MYSVNFIAAEGVSVYSVYSTAQEGGSIYSVYSIAIEGGSMYSVYSIAGQGRVFRKPGAVVLLPASGKFPTQPIFLLLFKWNSQGTAVRRHCTYWYEI